MPRLSHTPGLSSFFFSLPPIAAVHFATRNPRDVLGCCSLDPRSSFEYSRGTSTWEIPGLVLSGRLHPRGRVVITPDHPPQHKSTRLGVQLPARALMRS